MFDNCLVHRVEHGLVDVGDLAIFVVASLQSCSYDMTDDFTIITRQSIRTGTIEDGSLKGARDQQGAQTLLPRVTRTHGRQRRPFAPSVPCVAVGNAFVKRQSGNARDALPATHVTPRRQRTRRLPATRSKEAVSGAPRAF
jgi:hypothetical protein